MPPSKSTEPHRIRLRGPWECEPLTRIVTHSDGQMEISRNNLPALCRMTMPCRWGEAFPDFAGRVRYRRHFGLPTGLDAKDRLWLTFAGADTVAEVWLNGQPLGQHAEASPFAFEVTDLLRERNELVVEVESSADNGGLWGEVALEIHQN